jgi:nucleoside-diphosphate-sugar epimerase
MKLLFIGGTGLLSSACAELASARGHELFLLNRSLSPKYALPDGAALLTGDIHADPEQIRKLLGNHHFDVVVDFIAFTVADIDRDLALFADRADQFVFISSASAYQKPPHHYLITEDTILDNPFWQYARDKIACEGRLMKAYKDTGFPVTVVRPSLTYGPSQIPFSVGSWAHPWTLIDRIRSGQKIIVPGDGSSLWGLTWNADFAIGLVGLFGKKPAIGEAFQITSDEVLSWDQIYLEAFRALDIKPNIIHIPSDLIAAYWPHAVGSLIGDKVNSVVFDNSKIKRFVPEFNCTVNWAKGLRRAIAWHEAHPQFQTIDVEMVALWSRIIDAYERSFPG